MATAPFKTMGRYSLFSLSALFKFILKHWYLVIFVIIIFPAIYSSVQTAIETRNPLYPALELGKRIFAADVQVRDDTAILEEQGVSYFIGMEKPDGGIWNGIKYNWLFFWRVIYRFFGNIYLIFVPLVLVYRILRFRNVSEVNKNIFYSIIIFLLYLFVVNCLFTVFRVVAGQIQIVLPEVTPEKQIWYIFLHLLPLNGVGNFIGYLIGL